MWKIYLSIIVCTTLIITLNSQELTKLVNLDDHCLRCLCHAATGCNLTFGCVQGYCGPFKIGKIYWIDAGEVTLERDEKERTGAYEDCAQNYQCAVKIVTNYFIKFGKDCNDDGVTDCEDYAKMNFNGGVQCRPDLERNDAGKAWLARYRACRPKSNYL